MNIINDFINWINRRGRQIPHVGPLGLLILVVLAFGVGLLLLTSLPWILGIILLGVILYFLVVRL